MSERSWNPEDESRLVGEATLSASAEFEFLGADSLEGLNHRQRVALAGHRSRFIEWLRTRGKDPKKHTGYAESTVENYARRYHQIHRWVWEDVGTFTLRITHTRADAFVNALLDDQYVRDNGESYSTTAKRKFNDVLKAYFRWRVAEFGADDWEPPVEFNDETPANPADYFTRDERQRLYNAALEYKTVPSYNNLSPEERDRWKAYISQVLGKPKDEVRPADFEKLNRSWKIPSLIAATLDAGLRPCEIERMQLSWLRLDKLELHVPKDRAAKNREHWHVSIRERTAQALERWMEQRANKEKYDDRNEVWLNQNGNPYTSRTLNDLLDNLLDVADIDQTNRKLVWYSFRHSTGQYLHDVSDDLTTAAQLRHKDPSSVKSYAEPSTEKRRDHLNDIDG